MGLMVIMGIILLLIETIDVCDVGVDRNESHIMRSE